MMTWMKSASSSSPHLTRKSPKRMVGFLGKNITYLADVVDLPSLIMFRNGGMVVVFGEDVQVKYQGLRI